MGVGENKFWENLRDPLGCIGEHSRIESHNTAVGFPDVAMCIHPGIHWFIELKYSDDGHVRVRPAQYGWFRRWARVEANIAVLTQVRLSQGFFYMWHRPPIPETQVLSEWVDDAYKIWDHAIDFKELEEILRGD